MQIKYEDVSQELIDNELVSETEYDGMANDGSSEPMTDLDFESPQPEINS